MQSLSYCLDDSGDDLESRGKCILFHLSMDTPRLWWKQALETNNIRCSHANIINDLKKELLKIPELEGKIDSCILVALAFEEEEAVNIRFDINDNSYSIKEYLDKANNILIKRPELGELGRMIDNIR